MMISNNYAQQVAQAKASNASIVNFAHNTAPVQPIPGEKDSVTLSDKAMAMMNGTEIKEAPPTYVRPETARALLAQNEMTEAANESEPLANEEIDNRFNEMMQKIVDQRLGVDRKKLEELDALMEEIAKNENMSPEEKQLALEKLAEMREQIIEETREIQEVAKQTD